jgi:excinuclease UvrABC nuclease subunit
MPTNRNSLRAEAQRILDTLAFTSFEQCQPLSRQLEHIPTRPGLYAIRHKTQGLLYIGKSKSLRSRFTGGHKAFFWAWIDKYDDHDVRIAIHSLTAWEDPTLLLELEAILLRATEPPYNVQIPMET